MMIKDRLIKNMKKIVLWLFIITVVSFSISIVLLKNSGLNLKDFKNIEMDNGSVRFKEDINLEKAFDMLDIENINIETVSTDIRFVPEDRNDIGVHFHGSVASSNKIIFPEIIAEKQNKTLEIKIDYKNIASIGYYSSNIKLDIYIPNKYSKNIYIKTTSGDIELGRLNINNMNLISVSGDMQAQALYAKKTRLKTTSGEMKIENFKGKLSAETVSGDLSIDVQSLDNDISINSTSGDIEIRLPDKAEFYLESKSVSGDITCETPIIVEGKLKDNKVTGKTGKGNNKIDLSTVSGDIVISKKS